MRLQEQLYGLAEGCRATGASAAKVELTVVSDSAIQSSAEELGVDWHVTIVEKEGKARAYLVFRAEGVEIVVASPWRRMTPAEQDRIRRERHAVAGAARVA